MGKKGLIIFNLQRVGDRKQYNALFTRGKIQHVSDDYEEQQREYFGVLHPSLVYKPASRQGGPDFEQRFQAYYRGLKKQGPMKERGRWVYFPWRSSAAHILEDKPFQLVRTARNRNLITVAEQKKFYNAVVGIAGLSVGNSVALTIALQGGARHIKLADHDRLALSNTNRVRASVVELGAGKAELTARQIYEINPYAKVEIFSAGITPENIGKFFSGLDVVVDEIDNLAVKCLIREQAKKHKIAVVMGADNGDGAVIDIERYDQRPMPRFFHGRMGTVSYTSLLKLDKFGIGRLITAHIGKKTVTPRMHASLREMGKTIVSWPQLGGAAVLNGAAVAYCVRAILTGQPVEDNRALISFEKIFAP